MDTHPTEIDRLLEQARRGEPAALARLFAHYGDKVRQAVALRLDRRLTARVGISDVVQDTYLEASRRLPDYLHEAPLRFDLWLLRLARERVLMVHRQHLYADKRAVGRETLPLPGDSAVQLVCGLVDTGPSPSQHALATEAADRLRQAMDRLDEDERDVILWRHFERLSNADIAGLLGITEAAAAKRYIRALERLRGLLISLGVSGAG